MGPDLQMQGLGLNPVDFVLWSTDVKMFLALNPTVVPAPVPLFAEHLDSQYESSMSSQLPCSLQVLEYHPGIHALISSLL